MLPSLLFFLILAVPPFFLSVFRRKRFEETVAVACGATILVMFLCGILGFLEAGVYIVSGVTVLLLVLSVYMLIRRKGIGSLSSFFTPAFLAFTVVFVFLLFVHDQRLVHDWDEFSHWGDVVKAMSQINDFSTSPKAHSLFQSYVPGMALFQYLFQKIAMLFFREAFADWKLYFAYHLLAFVFLLPFFTVRSWKHFLPVFVLFLCISVIPSFLQADYLTSIYIDSFVGLLAGAGFALLFIIRKKPEMTANLLIICPMLVLSKDVGFLFALMLGIAFILQEIRQSRTRKRIVILLLLTVAAVALPKALWEINIRMRQAVVRFRDPIDPGAVWRVITQQDHSYLSSVFNGFFSKLFTASVSLGGLKKVSVTYPVLAVLLGCVLVFFRSHWPDLSPDLKKHQSVAARMLVLTFVVYLLGLPLIYMFRFSQYEAERLAGFDRYLSIVFDCFIIALFLLAAVFVQNKPKQLSKALGICLLVTLLAVSPEALESYISRTSVKENNKVHERYAPVIDAMLDLADGEEKRVWIIAQESNGTEYWPIRYGIRPCDGALNVGVSLAANTDSLYDGDIWTRQISAEEWLNELKDFDYVLIWSVNDTFVQDYVDLFERPGEIDSGCIYSVDHEAGVLVREYPDYFADFEFTD